MTGTPASKKTPWGEGRVLFRAHQGEILAQIALGWPHSRVWREFKDRLGGLSISQFNRYVRSALANPEPGPAEAAQPGPGGQAKVNRRPSAEAPASPTPTVDALRAKTEAQRAEQAKSGSLPTFHYDPMDAYRIKFD